MKLKPVILMAALAASVVCGTLARAQKKHDEKAEKAEKTKVKVVKTVEREERAVAAEPGVVITLCTESGKITVRGNDQREVRARVAKDMKVDFRRSGDADPANPAARLEVLVSEADDEDGDEPHYGQCNGAADIELDVPRDATLFFKSENGEFDVDTVAEAHIETSSGKISLRHVARATEATSVDGDVSLEDSSGRVRLETFGGSVEAVNVSKLAEGDFFKAKSISNDVMLDRVNHTRVEATTISGEITMRGPLARAGRYELRTTSGDITLAMPADSSFQLTAKVSEGGEIVTDFPLKYTGGISSIGLLSAGRMVGTYGKGDATISLVSFSGTLRLRKQ
jgi:DUF4097 and DUF4098 domain-containing protein YvlB